jgi:FkbM family methyltransferase
MRLKLEEYLKPQKNGVYIELGALDGVTQSNTKWLEDEYNWSGILIEPSIDKFKECKINRQNNFLFNCACVSFEYKEKTIRGDFNGSPMSSVGGKRRNFYPEVEIVSKSLQSVIDETEYKKINFLSLDVEGYELEVLKGIDFKKQIIEFILIEIYEIDKDNIFYFMEENGYDLIDCVSNFSKESHPNWDGTHNDYLFKIKNV